jgi:hypothetical protein
LIWFIAAPVWWPQRERELGSQEPVQWLKTNVGWEVDSLILGGGAHSIESGA